jgi:16S rRNA (cytidine1402-2'-O)-methyltransferase
MANDTVTTGTLFLVATPIGNYDDITVRALQTLRTADVVVYEERREGERLLRHFKIERPTEELNEHNESAATYHILEHLKLGRSVALVSDGGTPVFSDPGRLLVERAIASHVRIVPVPGASSLLPALIVSGFSLDQFLFYGWLSPKKDRRRAELRQLVAERRTLILMDTPYRLVTLLRDLAEAFTHRRMCIAFNLTLPDEKIYYGTAVELHTRLGQKDIKGEFVIVIEGKNSGARQTV